MEIHIDESGNLGEAGRYFVIAMIQILNKKRIKTLLEIITIKKVFRRQGVRKWVLKIDKIY